GRGTSEAELLTGGAVGYRRPDCDHGRPRREASEMHDFVINVQNRVLSVVMSVLQQNAITADVHPESRLVSIGLNSMGMVELMLKVEAEFDLILPQLEITAENFQSEKTIEQTILNQSGT